MVTIFCSENMRCCQNQNTCLDITDWGLVRNVNRLHVSHQMQRFHELPEKVWRITTYQKCIQGNFCLLFCRSIAQKVLFRSCIVTEASWWMFRSVTVFGCFRILITLTSCCSSVSRNIWRSLALLLRSSICILLILCSHSSRIMPLRKSLHSTMEAIFCSASIW